MTGEDDGPAPRVELRPHAQAHLVGLPAKQLRVDRPHEGVHAIETFGSGAGRQPFEIAVSTRDVTVCAGSDVDDDVSALRHEYRSLLAKGKEHHRSLGGRAQVPSSRAVAARCSVPIKSTPAAKSSRYTRASTGTLCARICRAGVAAFVARSVANQRRRAAAV